MNGIEAMSKGNEFASDGVAQLAVGETGFDEAGEALALSAPDVDAKCGTGYDGNQSVTATLQPMKLALRHGLKFGSEMEQGDGEENGEGSHVEDSLNRPDGQL